MESGNGKATSFLILPYLCLSSRASFLWICLVHRIARVSSGHKKKKGGGTGRGGTKRKKKRPSLYSSMLRGREKPLFTKAPRAHAHPRPVWTYSLFRPTQTLKKLHACQQRNWKNRATWHLTGTLSDMQVIILMIVPSYNPPHLWGFCSMYSNASA